MKFNSMIHASRRSALVVALAAAFASLPMAAHAETDKATTEALESYFDFVDYNSGTIMAEQIPA
ncbi:hypothetical protein ABW22_10825, partial [Thiobacillus denitrificans]